jgi:hypothetical protein
VITVPELDSRTTQACAGQTELEDGEQIWIGVDVGCASSPAKTPC